MTPLDFAASESFAFIRPHLPPLARVLEVGCGQGHLAGLLAGAGCRVTAIDTDEQCAADARARGVEAIATGLIEFAGATDRRFDAVVFVRSLHHIHPLDQAVSSAAGLLAPGGRLIVDDFDLGAPDEGTAAWFFGLAGVLGALEEIDAPARGDGEAALAAWTREHTGEPLIHPGGLLRAALAGIGALKVDAPAPYLYRYFCARLGADERGGSVARAIHRHEVELVSAGLLRAVGLRLVVSVS